MCPKQALSSILGVRIHLLVLPGAGDEFVSLHDSNRSSTQPMCQPFNGEVKLGSCDISFVCSYIFGSSVPEEVLQVLPS